MPDAAEVLGSASAEDVALFQQFMAACKRDGSMTPEAMAALLGCATLASLPPSPASSALPTGAAHAPGASSSAGAAGGGAGAGAGPAAKTATPNAASPVAAVAMALVGMGAAKANDTDQQDLAGERAENEEGDGTAATQRKPPLPLWNPLMLYFFAVLLSKDGVDPKQTIDACAPNDKVQMVASAKVQDFIKSTTSTAACRAAGKVGQANLENPALAEYKVYIAERDRAKAAAREARDKKTADLMKLATLYLQQHVPGGADGAGAAADGTGAGPSGGGEDDESAA